MALSDLSDSDLIGKAKELENGYGSYASVLSQYLSEIFHRYYRDGYNIARFYGMSRDDAEDAVQIAFIKVFKSLQRYNEKKPFKPWFFKIVLNAVRDVHGKNIKHNHAPIESAEEKGKEIFDKFHIRESLQGIISSLPDKLKNVVLLRNYADMTFEEISHTLGVSVRQLHNRLNQAYELIKRDVEEAGL